MKRSNQHARPLRRALWTAGIAALAGTAACAGNGLDGDAQPAPGPTEVVTTSNIVATVATANTAEVQTGQLALQKSNNPAVRQFAQRMITDHTQANQRLSAIAAEYDIQPEANNTTQQLSATARETVESLQQYSGAEFDRAYIDNQVAIHQWLLTTLDTNLIPAADNEATEMALREYREVIASHLQHAQQVQMQLR